MSKNIGINNAVASMHKSNPIIFTMDLKSLMLFVINSICYYLKGYPKRIVVFEHQTFHHYHFAFHMSLP